MGDQTQTILWPQPRGFWKGAEVGLGQEEDAEHPSYMDEAPGSSSARCATSLRLLSRDPGMFEPSEW